MSSGDPGPLVAVLLGTDHHRFDRPLAWTVELQERGRFRFQVQHAATPLPASLAPGTTLAPLALSLTSVPLWVHI